MDVFLGVITLVATFLLGAVASRMRRECKRCGDED